MSKFKERFKDKISVVGRDGVHINVNAGRPEGAQVQVKVKDGGYTAVPVGAQEKPVVKVVDPAPVEQNVSNSSSAADVAAVLRNTTPSPTQLSDTEWLQRAEAETKQQLLMLQRQLGITQRLPSISPSITPIPDATVPAKGPVQHGRRKDSTVAQPPKHPQPPASRRKSNDSDVNPSQQNTPKYGRRAGDEGRKYTPYTLQDYKLINQPVKLGGLGPDDSEEKQFLRHQKEMAKQYAESVKAANQAAAGAAPKGRQPITKQPTSQQKAAAERRAKALEFASKVPKPKVAATPKQPDTSPVHRIPTVAESEIATLEEQHVRDMHAIAEIKKNLGL